ncbi:hypothetical protein CRD60_04750 [Bifidobacterium aemilianum]|uniref:Uncharacterized protein n=1 Tax=Bifidobacterium aemilianum TaxID=2493120 RepID=A0A366K897_9BIFI|nr:hypothetical protein CRD60_04750 [Bifidobacterium aemilianum]
MPGIQAEVLRLGIQQLDKHQWGSRPRPETRSETMGADPMETLREGRSEETLSLVVPRLEHVRLE